MEVVHKHLDEKKKEQLWLAEGHNLLDEKEKEKMRLAEGYKLLDEKEKKKKQLAEGYNRLDENLVVAVVVVMLLCYSVYSQVKKMVVLLGV